MNAPATDNLQELAPVDVDGIIGVVGRLVQAEHERHRKRITELQNIVGVVRDLASDNAPVPPDLALALAASKRRRSEKSPIHLVRAAVKRFGVRPFTLDELCRELEAMFPDAALDRDVVSRRIYELRTAPNPLIVYLKESEAERAAQFGSKRKQRVYRYLGPPAAGLPGSNASGPGGR